MLLTRGLTPEGGTCLSDCGPSCKLEDQRVQGNEWAVGLGYGYHWILSRHWSLEAELGLGYSFADFDAYECRKCGDKLEERTTHRFVPTKLSVSFIYVFK